MATTNILIETFSGLGLPSTLSLPLPSASSISNVFSSLDAYLPPVTTPLRLTTTKGAILSPTSRTPLSSLLNDLTDDFLTLRLTAPLPGGKGGFGSQLRAAGGRMSSRKRKGQENSDSCRNLDGRRLRTVKEAKALAQYLETKPDMDKKERDKRKERWGKVIEAADEKIRGGGNVNQRFDDAKWLEEKDEGRDKAREAVLRAMKANSSAARVPSPSGQSSTSEDLEGSDDEKNNSSEESSKSSEDEKVLPPTKKVKVQPKKIFGFDEDDDFLSSSDEEEEEEVSGKGKARA
ncbi:hypothetical protein AOL_s00081g340 [Orbilia oligospora ATCC 24927]|uniref:Uncharacterized protein n=1 Tax=Arthrobotrys oligospora (strain ATCC 24927 / CBS 115.81 / DSM 1491) TaxID=756982 RepID=G1XG47_ARTOA|nr:hypothetical protein AOL_s00081g340 [Orbilia oligospora ATCC 24927]EGX48013.1 hypothetical protein AOL_s00081g340 [Orbilia oligospora ATCC 24927]